jgi:nicotianamine synthase
VTAPVVATPLRSEPEQSDRPASRDHIADRLLALLRQLEQMDEAGGLEPRDTVDRTFGELVALLCAPIPEQEALGVLTDPRVAAAAPVLRDLCATGEFRLERAWARRIAAAAAAERELERFPYRRNYAELSAMELHAAAGVSVGVEPSRACVLGSGPLPMTALLIARALGIPVDAIDLDTEATALADAVLARVTGGDLVRPLRADATSFPDLDRCDLVVLAALVGLDGTAKRHVIRAVSERMRPGAMLIVRGSHRLRELLYPPVSPEDLRAAAGGRLRLLAEVHPLHEVVNSFVLAVRV